MKISIIVKFKLKRTINDVLILNAFLLCCTLVVRWLCNALASQAPANELQPKYSNIQQNLIFQRQSSLSNFKQILIIFTLKTRQNNCDELNISACDHQSSFNSLKNLKQSSLSSCNQEPRRPTVQHNCVNVFVKGMK